MGSILNRLPIHITTEDETIIQSKKTHPRRSYQQVHYLQTCLVYLVVCYAKLRPNRFNRFVDWENCHVQVYECISIDKEWSIIQDAEELYLAVI